MTKLAALVDQIQVKQLDPVRFILAKKFYKQHGQTSKTDRNDAIFVVKLGTEIISSLRLAPCGQSTLLRSVFVAPQYRNQGVARHLIEQTLLRTFLNEIWTFPYMHVVSMYQSLGFIQTEGNQVPAEVFSQFKVYEKQGKEICVMRWQRTSTHTSI